MEKKIQIYCICRGAKHMIAQNITRVNLSKAHFEVSTLITDVSSPDKQEHF